MQHFDLVIIGAGSGNDIPPALRDRKVAMVEKDAFGGTCLNRGCIPSKMFVYAADVAMHVKEAARYDVDASFGSVDWPAIRDRVFGRIDPIAEGGEAYRLEHEDNANLTVFRGHGRFVGDKTLEVDGEQITGDRFLIAAGARPFAPAVEGLDEVGYHTSDTIMRVEQLPERLVVIGGGYIATELGHVFDAFGSDVTLINRGGRLLRSEDEEISDRYTEILRDRFTVHVDTQLDRVERVDGEIRVHFRVDGEAQVAAGDELLVATGRVPNSDTLAVAETGVETDPAGRVVVNQYLETNVEGIWALGDISNRYQLKHVSNAEAKIAYHNIVHPDDRRAMDWSIIPHAVFGHPQVASVGMTERDAAEEGVPFVCATKDYASVAYGWAMEDTTSFVKLIAHAHTRRLLGAHIIGPQASTLIQILIQGMRFGQTVDEMATEQMWIHPALTEVIENALLEL